MDARAFSSMHKVHAEALLTWPSLLPLLVVLLVSLAGSRGLGALCIPWTPPQVSLVVEVLLVEKHCTELLS